MQPDAKADWQGCFGGGGEPGARSHGCFVQLLTHFIPDSLTYSVPLFLKRRWDRTLGGESDASAAGCVRHHKGGGTRYRGDGLDGLDWRALGLTDTVASRLALFAFALCWGPCSPRR